MSYIKATIVLLFTLWCCKYARSDDRLNLIHARLVNMLRVQHRLPLRKTILSLRTPFRRATRSQIDLREHKLFHSDPSIDCCPTLTEISRRRLAVNMKGVVIELFNKRNFTQEFYETVCHPAIKARPCQFIDPRIKHMSSCEQQYTYVYAIGRPLGKKRDRFGMAYIRVSTGCKCQVRRHRTNHGLQDW